MKNIYYKILIIILSMSLFSCISIEPYKHKVYKPEQISDDMMQRQLKNIKDFKNASDWLVQEGIYTHYSVGDEKIKNILFVEFNTLQYTSRPWIDDNNYLARFILKPGGGLLFEIISLKRYEDSGKIYDFWIIRSMNQEWSGIENTSEFLITQTDNPKGIRKILKRSDTYFDDYTFESGKKVKFFDNNLYMIYKMVPWYYPESYSGTILEKYIKKEVIMVGKNKFLTRDIIYESEKGLGK